MGRCFLSPVCPHGTNWEGRGVLPASIPQQVPLTGHADLPLRTSLAHFSPSKQPDAKNHSCSDPFRHLINSRPARSIHKMSLDEVSPKLSISVQFCGMMCFHSTFQLWSCSSKNAAIKDVLPQHCNHLTYKTHLLWKEVKEQPNTMTKMKHLLIAELWCCFPVQKQPSFPRTHSFIFSFKLNCF